MIPESSKSANEWERLNGKIRNVEAQDCPAIKEILRQWIRDRHSGEVREDEVDLDIENIRSSLRNGAALPYLCAELNGQVIGVVGIQPPSAKVAPFSTTSHSAEIINMYVDSKARVIGGVGSALLGQAERLAKERGYTELLVTSGSDYEKTAWGFYDKIFGTRVGTRKDSYGTLVPIWRKDL